MQYPLSLARRLARTAGSVAVMSALVGVGAAACGSTTTVVPATAACDDTKCAPGNKCLDGEDGIKCRRTCASNDKPDTACPFGYTCSRYDGVPEAYCFKQTNEITKKDKGQWGAPCNPANGLDKTPDCDTDQSFACFARAPSDADAYCTLYSCESDLGCGPGFYCGDFNVQPNAINPSRASDGTKFVQSVAKACQLRKYCSPCNTNLDCPAVKGKAQFCVAGSDGKGFCTNECSSDEGCNTEALCGQNVTDKDGVAHPRACFPRAGSCTGDGSLCSPCRVDSDCGPDGACVKGTDYSTERFCAKAAPGGDCGQCPKQLTNPPIRGGCYKANATNPVFAGDVPVNYCMGLFAFDIDDRDNSVIYQPGCWSPSRVPGK